MYRAVRAVQTRVLCGKSAVHHPTSWKVPLCYTLLTLLVVLNVAVKSGCVQIRAVAKRRMSWGDCNALYFIHVSIVVTVHSRIRGVLWLAGPIFA
jgi:hypothetical protein